MRPSIACSHGAPHECGAASAFCTSARCTASAYGIATIIVTAGSGEEGGSSREGGGGGLLLPQTGSGTEAA